jgi:hypothetical protein
MKNSFSKLSFYFNMVFINCDNYKMINDNIDFKAKKKIVIFKKNFFFFFFFVAHFVNLFEDRLAFIN